MEFVRVSLSQSTFSRSSSLCSHLTNLKLGVERPYYGKHAFIGTFIFLTKSSCVAIEDLLQNYQPSRPRTAVAYYYFNFQAKEEQNFINLLRSILLQLCCQCPDLPTSVHYLQRDANQGSAFFDENLVIIVEEVLQSFREVYIVIDAFDECEQNEKVINWIQKLVENKDGRLHLLISSRQDYRFRSALESYTTEVIALDEYAFEKDIQLFIREQLSINPRMKRWSPSVQHDVEQILMAKSGNL